MPTPTQILQALHDSEINGRISWFYDGAIVWDIGDESNGWKETGNAKTLDAAVRGLAEAAVRRYPDSEFARAIVGL